jgi:hypothetical protein
MKKMSSHELTARINRFMDRKLPKATDLSDLSGHKPPDNYFYVTKSHPQGVMYLPIQPLLHPSAHRRMFHIEGLSRSYPLCYDMSNSWVENKQGELHIHG